MILNLFKKNIFYVLLFAAVFAVHAYWIFNLDDGVILAGAWDMYNGKKIYLDFFSYISPLSFYFIFFVWKLFGVSYFVAKFFSIIVFYFSLIGINKIARLFLTHNFSFIPPFLYLYFSVYWPLINHNLFSLFFIIWGLYFFLKSFDGGYIKNTIYSSSLLGLSVLFLQHRGGILIAGIALNLIFHYFYRKDRNSLEKFVYFIFFSFLFVLLLFVFWGPSIVYNSLIVFPLFNYSGVNVVSPFFLVLAILATGFFYLLLKKKNEKIYFLFYVQILLLLSVAQMRDMVHVLMVSFIDIIILSILLEAFYNHYKKKKYLNYFYYLFILIIVILTTVSTFQKAIFEGGIKSKKQYIIEIKEACHDSEYIYSGPFFPNIYSELEMLNPTSYSYLITGHQTNEDFQRATNSLRYNKPSCVILGYKMVERFSYDKNNCLDNYIIENYHFEKSLEYNTVLYKINLAK